MPGDPVDQTCGVQQRCCLIEELLGVESDFKPLLTKASSGAGIGCAPYSCGLIKPVNRASANRERKVAASGVTPLDAMLRAMRLLLALADESANDKKQFEHYIRAAAVIAKDAAPFVHPRLSAVEQPVSASPRRLIVEVIGGLPVGSTPERPESMEYSEVPPEETR